MLRNHGSSTRYYHEEIGWNTVWNAIQAGHSSGKEELLEDWNAKRNSADAYI